MNKLRNSILAALGVAILCTVVGLNTERKGQAAGAPVAVQITNIPVPVQVLGTASTEDINNQDLQPVQFELEPGTFPGDATAEFTVPAGKRLVIDYVAASPASNNTFPNLDLSLSTTVGGTPIAYTLFQNKNDTSVVNAVTHIYADPGTVVEAFLGSSAASTSPFEQGTAVVCVSGHYIND
jgi:hypothetical protein